MSLAQNNTHLFNGPPMPTMNAEKSVCSESWWICDRPTFRIRLQQQMPRLLRSSTTNYMSTATDSGSGRQLFKARNTAHPAAE